MPFSPLQAPPAVQDVTSVDDHDSVALSPASIVEGDRLTVTAGVGGGFRPGELSHHCCAGGMFQKLLPKWSRPLQPETPAWPGPWCEVPDAAPAKLVERHSGSPLQTKW